jgi:broad specificity phosphatase PhoE
MLEEPQTCARVVLLRHPQLAEPYRALALGQGDAELARRGREQTLTVLRELDGISFDRIYSAPTRHCMETAEALGREIGKPAESIPALHDPGLGQWEGKTWQELQTTDAALLREFFRDYGLVAPQGGETLADAIDRALMWWGEGVDDLLEQSILIVAGAPLISGFAARMLGMPIRRAAALSLPPAGFGVLDVYQDGAVMRAWHPLALRDDMP